MVDRLTITAEEKSRFTESVEKALLLGNGLAILHYGKKTAENETKISRIKVRKKITCSVS